MKHVHSKYFFTNDKLLLQNKLEFNLQMRNLDMTQFIKTMKESRTSGLDLTLLILCEMLNISIVVLFQNSFWKSTDFDLNDFHVYLIMSMQGQFISATPCSSDHINKFLNVVKKFCIMNSKWRSCESCGKLHNGMVTPVDLRSNLIPSMT